MELPARLAEKRKSVSDLEEDDFDETSSGERSMSKNPLEQDKRVRREIANSNERRRMQSINAGFQSLRTLIPHQDGEKMSKAGILQQSAEYINSLESEKTRLLTQNAQLKQILRDSSNRTATASSSTDSDSSSNGSPPPKRKKRDTESSDEGISMGYDDPTQEDLKKEMIELRHLLDRERRLRLHLEEEKRTLQAKLYPERPRQVAAPQVEDAPVKPPETHQEQRLPAKPVHVPSAASVEDQPRHREEHPERRVEAVVKPAEPRPAPLLPSSMSRRNLETIVEAIRHLEGDGMLLEHSTRSTRESSHHIPNSEESAEEDNKCESSGRESPLCLAMDSSHHGSVVVTTTAATATLLPVPRGGGDAPPQVIATADRYPIAMQLLHPGMPGVLPPNQFIHRPAVIVQKSS